MTNSPTTTAFRVTARRLATAAVIAVVTVLSLGLSAGPAVAEPVAVVDHPWQSDCDHTGPWQWQQNHGRWEWNNCDNANGHWEWHGDHGGWQWHRDRDVAPPPPGPFFGS